MKELKELIENYIKDYACKKDDMKYEEYYLHQMDIEDEIKVIICLDKMTIYIYEIDIEDGYEVETVIQTFDTATSFYLYLRDELKLKDGTNKLFVLQQIFSQFEQWDAKYESK